MPKVYTCDNCHQTFESTWTEEEAAAESQKNWGTTKVKDSTMAQVCDDCYQQFMAWYKAQQN
jgi:hypothetical protein